MTPVEELQFRILAERLREGPLPAEEVLHCAVDLAQALRQIHEQGGIYGNLQAARVILTRTGARLDPAGCVQSPGGDQRSDIFAFGALIYEMITGQKPSDAPAGAEVPQRGANGSLRPALLRLSVKCLAKDPERRPQAMQKILMELRLLSLAAADRRPATRPEHAPAALRAELAAVEARLSSAVADLRKVVEMQGMELDSLRRPLSTAEETLKAHARSIESMKVAMAQTDDLIERVVDAFNSLQDSMQETAAAY